MNLIADWQLGAALLLGLLGSSHCLVMCGGIGAALGMGTAGRQRWLLLLLFQFGRIASYTLLAGLIGLLPLLIVDSPAGTSVLRIIAALLLVSMGLYVGNWWRGLLVLEKLGQRLWQKIQPLSQRMLPVTGPGPAIGIGLCWGLLPCGLIYTALAWSATTSQGSPLQAAALMACFGLGTLPSMYASSAAGAQLMRQLQSTRLRRGAGIVLIVFGLWTVIGPASMNHDQHAGPGADATHHQHH